MDLEEMEDRDIETMRQDYEKLAEVARQELRKGNDKKTHEVVKKIAEEWAGETEETRKDLKSVEKGRPEGKL